jgi:hypothetical protein
LSDYLKSIAGWNSDGSLGLHWMERDMGNTLRSLNGYAIAPSQSRKIARYVRVTFPEPGKIILRIGPGDHTSDNWEIDREQLRSIILDGMPELLKW